MPFDQILPAVAEGQVDVGLIIHEGQLYLRGQGPAPGRRPRPVVVRARPACRCRSAATSSARISARRPSTRSPACSRRASSTPSTTARRPSTTPSNYARDLDPALADRFVGMYVNEWTVDYGPRGREAVRTLLSKASEAGFDPAAGSTSSSSAERAPSTRLAADRRLTGPAEAIDWNLAGLTPRFADLRLATDRRGSIHARQLRRPGHVQGRRPDLPLLPARRPRRAAGSTSPACRSR